VGGVHGHTKGKESLFRFGASKEGLICGGYVGGRGGAKKRFCTKAVVGDTDYCGDKSHGAKFPMLLESYYIRMEGETALCSPFLHMPDLIRLNSLSIVSQTHTSREWVEVIYDFLLEHRLLELEDDSKPAAVMSTSESVSSVRQEIFFPRNEDATTSVPILSPPIPSLKMKQTTAINQRRRNHL
jgi:hypothetical protein